MSRVKLPTKAERQLKFLEDRIRTLEQRVASIDSKHQTDFGRLLTELHKLEKTVEAVYARLPANSEPVVSEAVFSKHSRLIHYMTLGVIDAAMVHQHDTTFNPVRKNGQLYCACVMCARTDAALSNG